MSSSTGSDASQQSTLVEFDTGDFTQGQYQVCALGTRPAATPAPSNVTIPAIGDPVPSVGRLVADANVLEYEARSLRAHSERVTALNAGLVLHAGSLHDRNLQLLQRAREGFDMVSRTVGQLNDRIQQMEVENTRLEDSAVRLRTRAAEADAWETRYAALQGATTDEAHALQDQIAQEQARVAQLTAQLAAVPASTSPSPAQVAELVATRDELAAVRAELASVQAQNTQLETERDRHRRDAESVWALSAPLQDDLRRATALTVAYAEEHQRDVTRIRDLEEAVSTAEIARVAAQSDLSVAQAEGLRAASRSAQFRDGLLTAHRAAAQQQALSHARVDQLNAQVAELEEQLTNATREHDERAAAWRRLLREARLGRESARRVRDSLAERLFTVVTSVGGHLDLADLLRTLENHTDAAAAAAVPTPPADPAQAEEDDVDLFGDLPPSSPRPSSPPAGNDRSAASDQHHPRSTSSSPSRPSRSRSGSSSQQGRASTSGSQSVSSPVPTPRRSRRASTANDTAASDSAAAALGRVTSSVAGRRSPPPSSDPSGSESGSRSRRPKRRRLRRSTPTTSSSSSSGNSSGSDTSHRSDDSSGGRGDGSGDESSTSSSSRTASSSAQPATGTGAIVPLFAPAIPPVRDPSEWTRSRYIPWTRQLRSERLLTITVSAIRLTFLPPRDWVFPRVADPPPSHWNEGLLTMANVNALYDSEPWAYLREAVTPLTFAADDAAFRPYVTRLRLHLDHWAVAYWESTHELPVPRTGAWVAWRRRRNSRRSHAGDHLASVLQLAVALFQRGLADVDLLLDPMFLLFPPRRTEIGRWYPGQRYTTLQDALNAVDSLEPWRRFYRSPLDANQHCTVTRAHPAYSLSRLDGKFIQTI